MTSTHSRDGARRAAELAGELVQGGADAVALFGSVARGEARPDSDLDLLVVAEEPFERAALEIGDGVGVSAVTWSGIAVPRPRDWVFLSLVAREADFIHDPAGRLERELRTMTPPADERIARAARRLERFLEDEEELALYEGHLLLSLGNYYRFAKAAAMYGNARRGVFESRRDAALKRFAALYPAAADDVAVVQRLEPFYARCMDRSAGPEPFAPVDCMDEALRALSAARSICAAAGS